MPVSRRRFDALGIVEVFSSIADGNYYTVEYSSPKVYINFTSALFMEPSAGSSDVVGDQPLCCSETHADLQNSASYQALGN